jgi:hypothetical protein
MARTASKTPTATPTRPTRKPKVVTTVVGTMGTRTPQATPTRPARKVAAKATPTPKATPQAKSVPASRELPRNLVTQVAKLYAKASPADRQRVANYLKVVTTGSDAAGNRWWPDDTNLPRPTHFSWAKASK